jgi:hypothetical protein
MLKASDHRILIFTAFIFSLQIQASFAQKIHSDSINKTPFSDLKNEISIQLLNVSELDKKIFGVPSLAYQINLRQIHFKAQLGYYKGTSYDHSYLIDQREILSMRIGAFYHANFKYIQPFLGMEGFYGYSFRNYYTSYFQLREKTKSIGLSTVLGFRFWINRRFSAQINTRLDRFCEDAYKYSNVEDDMAPDPNVMSYITIENQSKNNRTKYSPMGSVGFSFHF